MDASAAAAAAQSGDAGNAGDTGAGDAGAGAGNAPSFLDSVPAEYKDKPYMQNIKSSEDMFKQFDGAQALIGATKVPGEGATPEQWGKFYDKLGRPEASDGYGLNTVAEGGQEISEHGKAFNSSLEKVFHEAGLNKAQVEAITKGFVENSKMLGEANGKINQEKSTAAFNAAADQVLGAEKEATLELSNTLLEKYMPEGLKDKMEGLDPEAKMVFASVLKGISDEYISSDDISSLRDKAPAGNFTSLEDIRAALQTAMNKPEYKDPRTPTAIHAKASAEVNRLSNLIVTFKAKTK